MHDALRIASNLAETMACFGRTESGAILRAMPGLQLVDVGEELRIFNTAVMNAPAGDEDELRVRLASARHHFALRGLPWSFWTCDALLPTPVARRTAKIAAEFDLRKNSVTPGMIAGSIAAGPAVEGLEIRRIADQGDRASFCRILSRMFEGPSDQLARMYGREALWTSLFRGYIGSIDSRDVCAGFAVAATGSLGIYALATLPPYGRRGYASALIRHAVTESRRLDGDIPLVLQATEHGLRLYERLGFRRVAEFSLYSSA